MDFASAVSCACNSEGAEVRLNYLRGLASKLAAKPSESQEVQAKKVTGFTVAGLERAKLRTLSCFGHHCRFMIPTVALLLKGL